MTPKRLESACDDSGELRNRRRLFEGISNSQAATDVNVRQTNSIAPQAADKFDKPFEFATNRIEIKNLRTPVRADALPLESLRIAMRLIEAPCGGPIEPKLVLMTAGRNVAMPTCLDIRIYPNRDWRAFPQTRGLILQNFQLRFGFNIEKKNSGAQCSTDFFARFTYSGKHHSSRRDSCAAQAIKLAGGDDIEAAPLFGEQLQN